MATAADIRQRVLDYLWTEEPHERPFETQINGSYGASATSIVVVDGTDWAEGDVLENKVNGDQYLVTSVSSNTLTVVPDYNGTTAAASSGTDDLVIKNPRFTIKKVDDAITDACHELGTWGIHGFSVGELTLVASQYFYELSESDISEYIDDPVLAVYYVDDTTEQPQEVPFRWSHQLSTTPTEWGAAQGVTLLSKGDRAAGDKMFFTYAQSYNFDTDLDTTLGKLEASHEELVVLLAVTKLLGHTIIPATMDPGARTDRTVSPGQTGRDRRDFFALVNRRIKAEAANLAMRRNRITSAGGMVKAKRARRWRS